MEHLPGTLEQLPVHTVETVAWNTGIWQSTRMEHLSGTLEFNSTYSWNAFLEHWSLCQSTLLKQLPGTLEPLAVRTLGILAWNTGACGSHICGTLEPLGATFLEHWSL